MSGLDGDDDLDEDDGLDEKPEELGSTEDFTKELAKLKASTGNPATGEITVEQINALDPADFAKHLSERDQNWQQHREESVERQEREQGFEDSRSGVFRSMTDLQFQALLDERTRMTELGDEDIEGLMGRLDVVIGVGKTGESDE